MGLFYWVNMAALGSLVVSLSANTAEFTAGMDKAAYQTDKAMKQMAQEAEAVGQAIKGMAIVGAGALALLVKNTIDAADNLRDMSQKTGIAVETLNGLGFAAGQAGGSLESIVGAAGKLNKSISEAAGGNKETAEAFKVLGISVLDASGNLKTADVVMAEVADQFENFKDGPEKSALALALFGKAGADMIPLLNDGGAAMRENTEYAQKYSGMTKELADASDNFNDTMGKLTLQQTGFANEMTKAVLPILQAVANETLNAAEKSDKFAVAGTVVRTVLQTLTVLAAEVAFVFGRVGNTIGGTAAQLERLAHLDFKGVGNINDMIKADDAQARKDHDAFLNSIMNPPTAAAAAAAADGPAKTPAPRLAGGGGGKKGKDPDADFKAYMKNLEGQIAKTQELTAVEKLLNDIRSGSLTVNAGQEARLMGIAQEIDSTKEAIRISSERVALRRKDEQDSINAIRQIEAEKVQETARNAANVDQIRVSLMSEVDQEVLAYGLRMQELQKFHDAKAENVRLANELMEAETARHEQTKADLQASYALQGLNMASSSADQLYGLMQKAGMEQTALGKAVFLASKALAIAEIIINTEVAAAKATAMFPVYGVAIATGIRIAGYASAGMVAGMAIAEVSAEGGYDIPAGVNPKAQLHEKEMVLPKQHADVIRGLAKNGGTGGGDFKLSLINNGTPQRVVETRQIAPDEWAMIVEDAVSATAAQMSDPNSKTSRAFSRNFSTQRSR